MIAADVNIWSDRSAQRGARNRLAHLVSWKRTSDPERIAFYTGVVSRHLLEWINRWDHSIWIGGEESDRLYQQLTKVLMHCMRETIGVKLPKVSHSRSIRWDPHVQQLKKVKNAAWERYQSASPEDRATFQTAYRQACRDLKKAVRKVKNDRETRIIARVESMKIREPREMWRVLKQLGKWSPDTGDSTPFPVVDKDTGHLVRDISEIKDTWAKVFRALGREKETHRVHEAAEFHRWVETDIERIELCHSRNFLNVHTPDLEHEAQWNEPIRESEIADALRRLRSHKAAAEDNIIGEMVKFGGEIMHVVLTRLLNFIFYTLWIPEEWNVGVIVPLYKKGPRSDPDNYRGITVSSVMYKVLAMVLNSRIVKWVESNGIIRDEQGGFRPGRGCPEQVFSLVEIVRYRRSLGKKTYCCFVDIKKAYDSVWRKGLWWKVWEVGIRGRMWGILKTMYRRVMGKVRVGKELSASFELDVGLKQGCPLSPTLFSIFFDSISKEVEDLRKGVYIGQRRICQLLYADDVVLIAENEKDLQTLVDTFSQACNKWKLDINIEKTESMVFCCKHAQQDTLQIQIEAQAIQQVRVFRYLGVDLEDKLGWGSTRKRLEKQARSAGARVAAMGISSGNLSIRAATMVWKCLIRSHLEYCAEVHGECVWREAEQIQYDMGRRILRCSRGISGVAVRGELGWWTMRGRRDLCRLRFWYKIVGPRRNSLVYDICKASRERYVQHRKSNWCSYTHKLLKELEIEGFWIADAIDMTMNEWNTVVRSKIAAREERTWVIEVSRSQTLRNYSIFKTTLRLEDYLTLLAPASKRVITKLRCSDLGLANETGRQAGVPRGDRQCQHCDFGDVDEDEEHLMTECTK
ncbi:MAG: RNA-directed DNA polymerase [Bacteroidota bacterium]